MSHKEQEKTGERDYSFHMPYLLLLLYFVAKKIFNFSTFQLFNFNFSTFQLFNFNFSTFQLFNFSTLIKE